MGTEPRAAGETGTGTGAATGIGEVETETGTRMKREGGEEEISENHHTWEKNRVENTRYWHSARGIISVDRRVFQRLGGRGYDDPVPVEVTKTIPSGDRTT